MWKLSGPRKKSQGQLIAGPKQTIQGVKQKIHIWESHYVPFHIRLMIKSLVSNKIILPKKSTSIARFPRGDMTTDKIERLLSGILESIGSTLDCWILSSDTPLLLVDKCCWSSGGPFHPNHPLQITQVCWSPFQTSTTYPAWEIFPRTAFFTLEATACTTSDTLTWPAS